MGLVLGIINCVFIKFGTGHHAALQSLDDIIITVKLAYVNRIFYNFCLGTTKIGICAFYLRIFPDRTSRILSWILMGYISFITLFFIIFTTVFCFPKPNKPDFEGVCVRNTPDLYVSASCQILADMLLLAFVAPRISELFLNTSTHVTT
jgi:hypothetical protein